MSQIKGMKKIGFRNVLLGQNPKFCTFFEGVANQHKKGLTLYCVKKVIKIVFITFISFVSLLINGLNRGVKILVKYLLMHFIFLLPAIVLGGGSTKLNKIRDLFKVKLFTIRSETKLTN